MNCEANKFYLLKLLSILNVSFTEKINLSGGEN